MRLEFQLKRSFRIIASIEAPPPRLVLGKQLRRRAALRFIRS